jgi:hypothetical protein
MQVKPGKNCFRLAPFRHMITGKIRKTPVVAQHYAAMALAIPQAGLSLNFDVVTAILGHYILHVVNQRLPACSPVHANGVALGIAAGRAKYERTHGLASVLQGLLWSWAFNGGKALICQRKRKRHELFPHRLFSRRHP